MMRTSDRILAKTRGSADAAIAWCKSHGAQRMDEVTALIREFYRLGPLVDIDASIATAQAVHETGNFTNKWWIERLNSGSLGITGDPTQNAASGTWANGTNAARAQIVHLAEYVFGFDGFPEALDQYNYLDPRLLDVRDAGWAGTVRTIADLTGKWATDPNYAGGICARGNAIFPTLEDQSVPTFAMIIPGLPGGPLVTDYPIRVDPIGFSERQRPGRKAGKPRRSVQHGNGNPDSSALGERNFLHSLVGGPTWISYHATADDRELWVLVPLDEVTFQAADGAGPGNEHGYSCEMVEDAELWANPSRRDRLIHVCADFMGRCAARFDVHRPERHWDFNWVECCDSPCDVRCGNRHHCPDRLMSTGLWETAYVPAWNAARIDELRRMGGQTATTTTTPAPKPPGPPKLPRGMSTGLAREFFNPKGRVIYPPTGKPAEFHRGGRASEAWLAHVLASNPHGKTWKDYEWPAVESITQRGDGRIVWAWSDGFVFEYGKKEA